MTEEKEIYDNPKIIINLDAAGYAQMDLYQRKDFDDCVARLGRINAEGKFDNITQKIQSQLDRIENRAKKLDSDSWIIAVMSASLTAIVVAGAGIAYTYSSRIALFISGGLGLLIAVLASLFNKFFKRKTRGT